MFRDKKTQFAIRKLTTGTGILLLSVGMGLNVSSKEVSASETDSAQTSETVQTESQAEPAMEQVELPTATQETGETTPVETPSVEEATVEEAPAETVTQEKTETTGAVSETNQDTTVTNNTNTEDSSNVDTGTQAPTAQPEAEKPGQDTAVTDSTNKDTVNTETQAPATQPETDKVDESEKAPAKNEADSSLESEKEESKTDSDKKDEVEKTEDSSDKSDSKTEADAAKPEKDNINDIINSILSDPDKLAEINKNSGLLSDIGDALDKWLQQYRPTWNQITNKDQFPGWKDFFDQENIKFEKVEDFDGWHPKWQSTTNKDIIITQIVNGESQDIKINYEVEIIIMPDPKITILDILRGHVNFVINDVNISKKEYENGKSEFDAVGIPQAPEGFENKVIGTVTNDNNKDLGYDLKDNIKDTEIKTELSDNFLKMLLQKGENVTFKYDIIPWPKDIDKDDIDKWEPSGENTWTGSFITEKVINQTVNGSGDHKITLTQTTSVTITLKDGKWHVSVTNPITVEGNSPININKPGYTYNKDEITSTDNLDFKIENGQIIVTDDTWKNAWSNLTDKNTIDYAVNYTIDQTKVEWPDKITDWIDNHDGTWSGNTTINKVINQTVNGSGDHKITLSQTAKVTFTWNKEKGVWIQTNIQGFGDITVEGNTPININKPGYNHEVSSNGNLAFTTNDKGQIIVTDETWKNAWNSLADKDTIDYTVTYKPDWNKVELPEGFDKDTIVDNKDGSFSTTINKVINQTVNNGIPTQITLSQQATFTFTWSDEKQKLLINIKDLGSVSIKDGNTPNINKPGYTYNRNEVSATINNTDKFTAFDIDNNDNISLTLTDLTKIKNGDKINYTVTYTPDWNNVEWPNGSKPDDVHQDKDGNWVGTINKEITQTVNGNSNKITLSQSANISFAWDADKGKLIATVTGFGDISVKNNNTLDIPTKPGYDIDTVKDDNANLDFDLDRDNGTIVITDEAWIAAWSNLKHGDTINYTVTYNPNFGDIKLPDGMTEDNLKPDGENTFTGSITNDKVINQIVNGGKPTQINLSQTVSVTVTLENGKWVVSDPVITVTGNSPLDISKPGYIINKVEADIIGSSDFKIENGNIVITDKVLANLKNDDTINYTVTYTPNWNNVEWPEDIDKDDINNWDQDDEGNWSGTATIDKVITQTVNGKDTNDITLSQSVNVTLKWDEAKGKLIATATPVGTITVDGNSPININKPGYKHEVTSDGNLAFKIENGNITITDETWQNTWATLKNGDKINYKVTYSPNFDDIKWPEGMGKDDFTQTDENTWTANTTINKVINQTVVNGGSNTLTWSQNILFTLTLKDGKWEISDKKADPVVTVQGDKLNISKPGYTINKVDTSIDKKYFTVDSAGNIVLNDSIWDTLKNGASLDIEYKATYTPNWNNVDWPEDIDKDKIEDWTENTDGSWTGTTSINKVINQTVNGTSNQITLSQAVTVNLTLKDGVWTAETVPGTVTVKDDNPLNITKPGYTFGKDDVSASINGTDFNGFKVDHDGNIVVSADAWATLNNGDTIKYEVTYSPDFGDIKWPEDMDKDDFTQKDENTWTANTTINKVINQTVVNGGSNTINWSQDISYTLTLTDGKWVLSDKKTDPVVTVTGDKLNINKPDYTIDEVSASIDKQYFTVDADGNIVLADSIWTTLKNGEKLDITYNVTYTPTKPQPGTVTPPDKDDNIWSEDVTDKEKDDIIDKIEDGGLTWTDNGDGTWSATVDFNKQLSQSVTGNMINGLPSITVDVTKEVTLIAELKGDKFHITNVQSGKWTSDNDLSQKLPESDNKYDISTTVNGTNHAGLKEKVENTNTIPGLDSELIQSIINNHEYGSILHLGYIINANPGSADPDKPAEPDTPDVDPGMGVTPDQPDDPAAEPGKPAEPDTPNVDPDMGVTPDQPDDPAAEPGKPAEPDTPNVDPDMGVTPDQPDDPAADPGKPAEPDTPNVDPDMGVTPEEPSNPDTPSNPGDNNGSGDSNTPGNNPGSSDSTDNIQPKPEESPDSGTTSPGDEDFTRPLPEKVEEKDKDKNKDTTSSTSSKAENNKNSTTTKGSHATGKKATIVPLSESAIDSKDNSTNSQNGSAATENEAALPQTGEAKDNMTMMGIIMAGLAGALTTLGTAIKKKKKN